MPTTPTTSTTATTSSTTTATFATPAPITATLTIPAGRIHLTATDRPDTHVEITPTDPGKTRDVKVAEHTSIDYHDGHLHIEASAKNQYFGPSGSIQVTVHLPTGSTTAITADSAEITTTGPLAAVTVTSQHGTIHIAEAATAHLSTVAGDVLVGHLHGPGQIRTSKGDIRISQATHGTVTLRTDAGQIDIGATRGVAASLDAGTSHGRIHNSLNNTTGPDTHLVITATTSVGDIHAHSL